MNMEPRKIDGFIATGCKARFSRRRSACRRRRVHCRRRRYRHSRWPRLEVVARRVQPTPMIAIPGGVRDHVERYQESMSCCFRPCNAASIGPDGTHGRRGAYGRRSPPTNRSRNAGDRRLMGTAPLQRQACTKSAHPTCRCTSSTTRSSSPTDLAGVPTARPSISPTHGPARFGNTTTTCNWFGSQPPDLCQGGQKPRRRRRWFYG